VNYCYLAENIGNSTLRVDFLFVQTNTRATQIRRGVCDGQHITRAPLSFLHLLTYLHVNYYPESSNLENIERYIKFSGRHTVP
jgi:hypothetical protein